MNKRLQVKIALCTITKGLTRPKCFKQLPAVGSTVGDLTESFEDEGVLEMDGSAYCRVSKVLPMILAIHSYVKEKT